VPIEVRHCDHAEDHRDDEHDVHAQRFFDHVAGQVLEHSPRAVVGQAVHGIERGAETRPLLLVPHIDNAGEGQSEGDPDGGPGQGFAHADDMGPAMKDAQVQGQHQQDEQDKAAPQGQHGLTLLHLSAPVWGADAGATVQTARAGSSWGPAARPES